MTELSSKAANGTKNLAVEAKADTKAGVDAVKAKFAEKQADQKEFTAEKQANAQAHVDAVKTRVAQNQAEQKEFVADTKADAQAKLNAAQPAHAINAQTGVNVGVNVGPVGVNTNANESYLREYGLGN